MEIDKKKLREDRKSVLAFAIWFNIFYVGGRELIKEMSNYPGIPVGMLLGIAFLVLSIACTVACIKALRRLTKIVYVKHPGRNLTLLIILIFIGVFFTEVFPTIGLFKMWFDVKKLLD